MSTSAIRAAPASKPAPDSLPHHDIMIHSFVNLDMMKADHTQPAAKTAKGSAEDKEESVLEKKLRLSTTSPVNLALQDASRALVEFETNDPIGKALKGGLPKELDYFSYLEIQQLQRKIAKKERLLLDGLYAQYLRCPADESLEQYMPRTSQTPKPSRIKSELRSLIAEKYDVAVKEARLEVFGKYSNNGELKHIMERFDEIASQGAADRRIVAKKMGGSVESLEAAVKGPEGSMDKLPRREASKDVLETIAEKIETTRANALAQRLEDQKTIKEQKVEQRLSDLKKLKADGIVSKQPSTEQLSTEQSAAELPKGTQ